MKTPSGSTELKSVRSRNTLEKNQEISHSLYEEAMHASASLINEASFSSLIRKDALIIIDLAFSKPFISAIADQR
tara:strand:+ start:346 stop:570 length:225 start_codon:yes stop_codon:yes gene_type:complete